MQSRTNSNKKEQRERAQLKRSKEVEKIVNSSETEY